MKDGWKSQDLIVHITSVSTPVTLSVSFYPGTQAPVSSLIQMYGLVDSILWSVD